MKFQLISNFEPKGDQPQAIDELVRNIDEGKKHQVLLGVTGSGKTFSIAHVISRVQKPTLVMAPNKTLAAQLYTEFKELFPHNAVEYFISYYDYYQPEAYLPSQDLYIEKDSSINDAIDRLRHSATHSLLTRDDVIIVASVSCIYGLGSPEDYKKLHLNVRKGDTVDRDKVLSQLIDMRYERNDYDFHRGTFRVKGDVVEIIPAYEDQKAIRLDFFGDEIERIVAIDPLTARPISELSFTTIFPNSHYVTSDDRLKRSIEDIRQEMVDRVKWFKENNKLLEAQRIEQRTNFDLEMIQEVGTCKGIENYSRYLTGRKPGEPPPTLIDYFPHDFLCVIDESHVTVPQVGGMYNGDRARKQTLVEYGFRLPSAFDNRPLKQSEFEALVNQVIYVSATPAEYELLKTGGVVVEQVVRPTGLTDPAIEVRPVENQVEDLLGEINDRVNKNERVLVTTLTKRMAENLAGFYQEKGVRVRYLHSDVESMERVALLRDLRKGEFDVLVGINLLREGLDLPEVSLVAIFDADKEGFLRSERSLIQTFGRAARNVNGKVILYADKMTNSMHRAISETDRRRQIQEEYNFENNITPQTIVKAISDVLSSIYEEDYVTPSVDQPEDEILAARDVPKTIARLRKEMLQAAADLEFEKAAELRDKITRIEKNALK